MRKRLRFLAPSQDFESPRKLAVLIERPNRYKAVKAYRITRGIEEKGLAVYAREQDVVLFDIRTGLPLEEMPTLATLLRKWKHTAASKRKSLLEFVATVRQCPQVVPDAPVDNEEFHRFVYLNRPKKTTYEQH